MDFFKNIDLRPRIKLETIYPKVPNYFHYKENGFPCIFIDFDVKYCIYKEIG